ncbi:hypothetical protein TPHA_0B04310 [Tetrapisispora phaffii CBS 4417]|uniref:DUF676 domain-containing protein n=1 Tax=Tetrapisispora phaffii (strain ATCC 24235 / CBS 4417 / NBRC 1672 / NRRL Y-8282 / UCD 70-5) TaxID=1071381 RepID=G8BQ19_TETPH|nr:hypothetical protein TPHA_0B04310 [Tetrapisispora phaffii CBS 4417]CCE62100.1 hypothetical protein TPHA_0B04310 [Tetrapisispora phaffii CBS 4417]
MNYYFSSQGLVDIWKHIYPENGRDVHRNQYFEPFSSLVNDPQSELLRYFNEKQEEIRSNTSKSLFTNILQAKDTIFEVPPLREFHAPKNPVVLCHGLSGFDKLLLIPLSSQFIQLLTNNMIANGSDFSMEDLPETDIMQNVKMSLIEVDYWNGIKQILELNGCTVLTATVPGFGTIEKRALALNQYLEKEAIKISSDKDKFSTGRSNKIKLNLVSHSMGGLDSRYLISNIPSDLYDIVSLTTIATPHRGSQLADFVVDKFNTIRMNSPIKDTRTLLPRSIYQLTTYYMKYFNNITPDRPDVKYFSYGCCFNPNWYNLFFPTWNIIDKATNGEPNDGMVTVSSSKWGEYSGTLANTDHMDIINWRNRLKIESTQWLTSFEGKKKVKVQTCIDPLQFYLLIADNLGRKGF